MNDHQLTKYMNEATKKVKDSTMMKNQYCLDALLNISFKVE
ncbi:MAG: hypothetical protein N4A64_10745 [Marinisporobacter sp.]|jgi:hypothetical protein|nr:hypothetical protein [Marinisporobacter sp.]